MSEKKYPIARLRYYCKTEKREYDIASVWANERFDWKRDVSPQKENVSGEYPKMRLSEAAARAERGEGYLSYAKSKPKQSAPKRESPRQKRDEDDLPPLTEDDFNDDIPF